MDNRFMDIAVELAKKAGKRGDVPVGAVIVRDGKVLSCAYNKKNAKKNAIYHAEIIAIEKACKKVRDFRLTDCDIYITKEPCLMCLGAILSARMRRIIFGAEDKKYSNIGLIDIKFNHSCDIINAKRKDCADLLTEFFVGKRRRDGDRC